MSLHCDADEMLARAKDLFFVHRQHNAARSLAIDAAAVFDQAGNTVGAEQARHLVGLIDRYIAER